MLSLMVSRAPQMQRGDPMKGMFEAKEAKRGALCRVDRVVYIQPIHTSARQAWSTLIQLMRLQASHISTMRRSPMIC